MNNLFRNTGLYMKRYLKTQLCGLQTNIERQENSKPFKAQILTNRFY